MCRPIRCSLSRFIVSALWSALPLGLTALLVESAAPQEIVLEQTRIWSPPSDFTLAGVEPHPQGITMWSTDGRVLTLDGSLRIRHQFDLPSGDLRPTSVIVVDGQPQLLMSTVQAVLLTLDPLTGTTDTLHRIPNHRIVDAAHQDSAWVLLLERLDADASGSPPSVALARLPTHPEGELEYLYEDVGRGRLTAWADGISVAATDGSRGMVVFQEDGTRINAAPPQAALDALAPSSAPNAGGAVVGLTAIPLDRGYLQVLGAVDSELRAFVRYDPTGVPAAWRVVEAPIGLFAADPAERSIFGLQQLNHLEVVRYSWRWTDGANPPD